MSALYIVATPIGNLEDISGRAVRILTEVDLIACEDTRHSQKLFNHLKLKKSLFSCHEHNEKSRIEKVIASLEKGDSIALITDAGTPGISDPGQRIVEAVRQKGFPVIPVPGPSAVTAALSASGFQADSFYFGGFLPIKETLKKSILENISSLPSTLVFYEAPHRILKTLKTIRPVLGNRRALLFREITKKHEETVSGTLDQIHQTLKSYPAIKGEIVLIIEGGTPKTLSLSQAVEQTQALIQSHHLTKKEAAKRVAQKQGLSANAIYKALPHS